MRLIVYKAIQMGDFKFFGLLSLLGLVFAPSRCVYYFLPLLSRGSCVKISVETGSGQPGHIFSGSSGLDHVRNEIVRLTTWNL